MELTGEAVANGYAALFDDRTRAAHLAALIDARINEPSRWPTVAIVRKIVEEHGGRIDLANRKEGGARISILLTRLAPGSDTMDATAQEKDNAATQ